MYICSRIVVVKNMLCIALFLCMHYVVYSFDSYVNNWFPVVPISSYDFSNPSKITILNKEFVLWKKNENEFVVQDDKCSHRCAPLSEGYLDRTSGNLRCSYHGWEFTTKGSLGCLPQSNTPYAYGGIKRLSIHTYETCVYGDILWAFLGNKTAEKSNYINGHPFKFQLVDGMKTMMREVPYDFFILLENLFDPAHVPFAHHKLQSVRERGGPVKVDILCEDESKFKVSFTDTAINRGSANETYRKGTMNFELPCHYYVESIYPPNSILDVLHVFTIPVQDGYSRILIQTQYNKNHPLYNIVRFIPPWIQHTLTNKFFDSDTLLLHEQERILDKLRLNGNGTKDDLMQYNLMTESDYSVFRYNRWMKRNNGLQLPYYKMADYGKKEKDGREVDRKMILDRYSQHTKNCIHCKGVLTFAKRTQRYAYWVGTLSAFLLDEPIFAALGGIVWLGMDKIKRMLTFEDYVHNNID